MRKSLPYLCLLSAIFCHSEAFGEARNVEIVRHPSLLMLGDFSQAVSYSYGYAGNSSEGSSSSSSAMKESYSVSTVGAILDPDVVTLLMYAGISYQQQFSDQTTTSLNTEYNLVANAFDVSFHPVVINSARTSTIVSNGYMPTYTLTRNSNQVTASLLHKIVPVRMFYSHATLATEGLPVDSNSSTDTLGFSLHHQITDVTNTELTASYGMNKSMEQSSRFYSALASNALHLDRKQRHLLLTKASISESMTDELPQQQYDLSAALSSRFGAALTGTLAEQFSSSSTVNFDNQTQDVKSTTTSASLSHRLFRSLTTTVSGTYGETRALGGKESNIGGTGTLAYNKTLPAQSVLSLTGSLSRMFSNQNFQDTQLVGRDEEHLVVQQGDVITPNLSGGLVSVNSVQSRSPDFTFLEGVDYTVNLPLKRIEIVIGGGIPPGTNLFITYVVELNQSLRYLRETKSAASNLSMNNGRYIFAADYSTSDQTLLEGETANDALVSSTVMNLRADANYADYSYGVEFGTVESTQESLSRAGAHWTYSTYWADGKIRFSAREIYTMYDASENSSAYNSNVVTLSSNYSKKLYDWLRMALSVNASDSRASSSQTNKLFLRAGFNGTYRQLTYSLNGQTAYRFSGNTRNRSDSLNFSITRYF